MVKKKELEKLSDHALEKYILPQSRFVSEAIEYAFEILKERGRTFTETESEQILNLIHSKQIIETESDLLKRNGFDKNITENKTAVELYTNNLIFIFSIVFGVIFGTFLQVFNFYILKNYIGLVVTLIFGICFTFLQIMIVEIFGNVEYGIDPLRFLFSGIGATGLIVIRDKIFKTDLHYRAKSFVIPLLISIFIFIPIYIFNF